MIVEAERTGIMRFTPLALLLPALVMAGGQDNEAEKLFRDMEKKIAEAKTLRVSYESKITGMSMLRVNHVKGKVSLSEGNKTTLEEMLKGERDVITIKLIGDGKKLKTVWVNPPGKEFVEPLPKHFNANLRTGLSRVCVFVTVLMTESEPGRKRKELDLSKMFQASSFKLGGTTKLAGREAVLVEYQLKAPGGKMPIQAKVWIDTKTHLPLKRELLEKAGNRLSTIVETYSSFTLGKRGGGKSSEPPK